MITIILACVAMIAKDAAQEFCTIAQVRGRALLASVLAPVVTLTGLAVTVLGAGTVIQDGLTPHACAVIAGILVVDTVDGWVFTTLGKRIQAVPDELGQAKLGEPKK